MIRREERVAFDLKSIEALAPDQASLSAASKLTKRSSWVRLERNAAQSLIWGECQGSGANPYRTMADTGDQGYKCTCPSRKFPCKHSLALMWIEATTPQNFTDAETPEWVVDWVGRRRKGSAPAPSQARPFNEKNISEAASQPEAAQPEDPAAAERRAAQQARRAEDTKASNVAALDELDQWIAEQLRLGLTSYVDAASERCRRIAARLVDMKAAALAGRIDEIPSRLMALRSEERAEAAIRELGKLVLLAKAWRQSPESPGLKRMISNIGNARPGSGQPRRAAGNQHLGSARREDRDAARRAGQPFHLAARRQGGHAAFCPAPRLLSSLRRQALAGLLDRRAVRHTAGLLPFTRTAARTGGRAARRNRGDLAVARKRRGAGPAGRPCRTAGCCDIRSFFPQSVVQVVQKDAFERLDLKQMLMEPEFLKAIEADVNLVADLISLRNVMPSKTKDLARSVNVIVLLALTDRGRPGYDTNMASAVAAVGIPVFTCTPDLFPDMMAAALRREDIGAWAAGNDIKLVRPDDATLQPE